MNHYISKITNWYKCNHKLLFYPILVIMTLAFLIIKFYFLNKGLIFSDEGWYLYLLRDAPSCNNLVMRYQLIFKQLFGSDIQNWRVFQYCLNLLSSLFFAYGLNEFLKKINCKTNLVTITCFLFLAQVIISSSPSLNYITLNLIIVNFALGFFLLSFKKYWRFCLVLSGFTLSFLFPTMITNVVIIPILFILLILFSDNKKFINSVLFISGIVIFFAYYILFVENINEIISYFTSNLDATVKKGSSDYGIMFLLSWTKNTALVYIKYLLIAIFLYAVVYTSNKYPKAKYILVCLICFLSYKAFFLISFNKIIWILFFYFIISKELWKENRKLFYLCIFFAFIPFALSFGTNVSFEIRHTVYLLYVSSILYILAKTLKEKSIVILYIICCFALKIASINGENWHKDKYLEQTIPVSSIGIDQNLFLDKEGIERLKFLKTHLNTGDAVVCDFENWGGVVLLDLKPVTSTFRIKQIELFEENIDKGLCSNEVVYLILQNADNKDSIDNFANSNKYNTTIYSNPTTTIIACSAPQNKP